MCTTFLLASTTISFVPEIIHAYGGELVHRGNNNLLELLAPNGVQLIDLLVLRHRELGQVAHEALGRFCILLRLQPIVFHLLLAVLL